MGGRLTGGWRVLYLTDAQSWEGPVPEWLGLGPWLTIGNLRLMTAMGIAKIVITKRCDT